MCKFETINFTIMTHDEINENLKLMAEFNLALTIVALILIARAFNKLKE